jgi:hypothetical protein
MLAEHLGERRTQALRPLRLAAQLPQPLAQAG